MKAELQNISSSVLYPFVNHPFSVRDDEAMEKMKESVRENGILNPVLVRPRQKGGYEIISGHRRVKAGELLRLPGIPCLVCDMDDDHAIIAMADSNLSQRERLRPSERAFALRMKSEAARRIRLANLGSSEEARVSETVAKDSDMSARQVERYVKLTKLNRQLLDMLDAGEINMSVAQELANLSTVEQCWVHDYMKEHGTAINAAQAKKLRRVFQKEGAIEEDIAGILAKETAPPVDVEQAETTPDIISESYSHKIPSYR